MKSKLFPILIFLTSILILSGCNSMTNDYLLSDATLVWSDEFDQPSINPENWKFEIGGHGWGNNELEYYTDRSENAFTQNGELVIQANEENYNGSEYTSARMVTQDLQEFQFGRIEARIKLPTGKGIWPAFWMLGANFTEIGWPDCGEIDIMEHVGSELKTAHGTIHGPGYYGGGGISSQYRLEDENFSDDYHTFAIEWVPGQVQWFVDGNLYHTVSENSIPEGTNWVYDQPFFLILNIAVGGNMPGSPDSSTQFPQQMLVDYVRVYQADSYEGMADTAERMISSGIDIKMKVADFQLSDQQTGAKWRAIGNLTILDEFGAPVKCVEVTAKWSGNALNDSKAVTLKTDQNGQINLQSPKTAQPGKIFFCIETIVKENYTFDSSDGLLGCQSVEH